MTDAMERAVEAAIGVCPSLFAGFEPQMKAAIQAALVELLTDLRVDIDESADNWLGGLYACISAIRRNAEIE